jgi:hypothetical protein
MGLVGAMFGWVFFYRIILEDREGLLIVRAVEDGCYVQQICGWFLQDRHQMEKVVG